MLSVEELKTRSYEERMEDVMKELPIRSSEWTNYNVSDPGITILENLTAFLALQGVEIVSLSYRAKMALLKMAGFVPAKGKCARVLLSAEDLPYPVTIPPLGRFTLGNLTFETNKEVTVGSFGLTGVFAWDKDGFKDFSYILDRELHVPAKLFGEKPVADNAVYFIFGGNTDELNEAIFYARMVENNARNATEDRTEHIFADIDWEVYTPTGFEKVNARDFTGAFVNSGEIRLNLSGKKLAVYEETATQGYCIRAVLTRAEYDIVPRITNLFGFLFEVWQKDTRSFCMTTGKNDRITIKSPIGKDVYYLVFGKEKKGSSYKRYELSSTLDRQGRYVRYTDLGDDGVSFEFDEQATGFAPIKCKDAVRVIVYSESVMRKYNVGKVIGCDDQEIEIPLENIVNDSFFLIARREGEDGYIYDFVRPEKKVEGGLYYHLLEGEGKIIIEDAGDFIDADLFMGSAAVTEGERGNIAAGNMVSIEDNSISERFYNPGAGTGGAFRENLEQVRDRFLKDLKSVYRAVTASDYEEIVKSTPGLCIRKAKAILDENLNTIKLAVLPDSDEKFPTLSDIYIDRITERLEDRRLLTSRYMILKPAFVAVGVKCTVYVRRHFGDCRKQIEDRIRSRIDYINSDRNFGERLNFEDIFYAIEDLECVDYVYDLSLHSENDRLAKVKEYDLYPRADCLCYPGEIQLEIVTADR